MNCPSCKLAYSKTLKPMVLSCGHTFCSTCTPLSTISKCVRCHKQSKPVINIAIYQQYANQALRNIDKYIKICLFGNMSVGKSSILNKLITGQFIYNSNPTIGIDFKYIDKQIDGLLVRYQIWDSAGQQKYRSMTTQHIKGSDIILLVYDIIADSSQNQLYYWIQKIEQQCQHNNIIVIGNKCDLLQQKMKNQKISTQPLKDDQINQIKQRKWLHIKTSCLKNNGIQLLWENLINLSRSKKKQQKIQKIGNVKLSKINVIEGKTCWQKFKQSCF